MYIRNGYSLFRNDGTSTANNTRPYEGTAVYSQIDYYSGYPYFSNGAGVEITVMRFLNLPHTSIIGLYRSPRVPVMQLSEALREVFDKLSTHHNIFIGDLNINGLHETQRTPHQDLFTRNNYRQLVSCSTTDNNTCIDHIY